MSISTLSSELNLLIETRCEPKLLLEARCGGSGGGCCQRERGERGARDKRGERREESEESKRVSISTLSSQPNFDKHIEFGTQFAYRNAIANSICISKRGVGVRGEGVVRERERGERGASERQERAGEERRARRATALR